MNYKMNYRMNKKGQAAMDFMMTYGWAILAVIIAIGVLAALGVFSPGKYTSGSALVTAPFYLDAWNVKVNAVNLEVRNNGGETLNVSKVSIFEGSTEACVTTTVPGDIITSSPTAIVVPCGASTGAIGDSFKGDIVITYTKSGGTVELTSTGTITEKVTA